MDSDQEFETDSETGSETGGEGEIYTMLMGTVGTL